MEAFLIYIFKASGILILFYATYEIFLKKETFFHVNRVFLMAGLIIALAHPYLVIKNYVDLDTQAFGNSFYTMASNPIDQGSTSEVIGIVEVVQVLFLLGFTIMFSRFLIQIFSIGKLIRTNQRIKLSGFTLVEIKKDLVPFSFFNYIFYNPDQIPQEEWEAVLEHEKVHCKQWHSLDMIAGQLLLILLWVNPLSWLYVKNVKQNLEYLADRRATERVGSRKVYEYTMLKISGNLKVIPVTNNFYNSLIKKRIVMLHQRRSNKKNVLKTLIILPVLALFLWSFNSETVYLPPPVNESINFELQEEIEGQSVKIKIDKNTTDEELLEIKEDLAEKGIDFSYTVVHNEQKEIIDLNITLTSDSEKGKSFTGSSNFQNDGKPIDPIIIVFDSDNNMFFMGNEGDKTHVVHTEKNISTWIHSDDDEHEVIEIYKEGDKEVIKVNGKQVSRKELEKMEKEGKIHKARIKIDVDDTDKDKTKKIIIKMDDDADHEIDYDIDHEVKVISGDKSSFFFMNGDVDKDWLILLDGKEVDRDAIEDLDPDEVETINVIKGDKASEKYGKKAKAGVIEITTKN